jgi:hypothetical protein
MNAHVNQYELGLISKETKDEHYLLFLAAFAWRYWVL